MHLDNKAAAGPKGKDIVKEAVVVEKLG